MPMPGIIGGLLYAQSLPAGDVSIAVQDFETGSSTGAQSFTTSALAGVTPEAALIIGCSHEVTAGTSESANATIMVGAITGAGNIASGTHVRNGQATTINASFAWSNAAFMSHIGSNSVGEYGTGALVPGGIELDFFSNDAINRRYQFIAFAGDGCESKLGTIELGTGTAAIDVNTVGFEPDAVIFFGRCGDFDTSGAALGINFTFGIATADNTQRCVVWHEQYNIATTTPFQAILNDSVAAQLSDAGALSYKIAASDFDSSGFSVTPSASAGNDDLGYLALKLGSSQCKLVDFDTPTSTGADTITGMGFTPQFILAVLTNLEAVYAGGSVTSDADSSGLAICSIGNEQWSTSVRHAAASASTNCGSVCLNAAMVGASNTAAAAIKATLTGFNADGADLLYSDVQGDAKIGFALGIQA